MHSINENAERSAAFFNHASLGILVINGKGEIISVNPFLLKMFGYSSEEVIGNKIELLIPARYKSSMLITGNNISIIPKSRPMGIGMDLFAVRKDGVEFPVEVSLGNYTEGDEHFVIGFVNDISIRKKQKRKLKN
jgi:PAS domain S-box-containing protein